MTHSFRLSIYLDFYQNVIFSRKLKIGHLFLRRSFAGKAKKFTKERSARAEFVVLLIAFLTFSLPSPS